MKIQLPDSFEYHERSAFAQIHNGILEMTPMDFEKIMYQLTYRIKDTQECPYCHRKLDEKVLTLDHIFPRDYGGISITDNLVPCCKNCNCTKGNLLYDQYMHMRQLNQQSDREEWIRLCQEVNEENRRENGIIIPKQWYSLRKDYAVFSIITSEQPFQSSNKYQRILDLYNSTGKICKPIVVSQNRFILDGFMALLVAKNLGFKGPLPFITLENVIVI